jgi:hypothetical protein
MNICRPWRRDVDDENGLKQEKGLSKSETNGESQESIRRSAGEGKRGTTTVGTLVAVLIQKGTELSARLASCSSKF